MRSQPVSGTEILNWRDVSRAEDIWMALRYDYDDDRLYFS